MLDFGKVKLIIWDLDNTFWQGIISETLIQIIPQNIRLVKELTDAGIINSICSKNTFEVCEKKLKELDIFDYFVFPSIDWTPKGQRIKELIQRMALRPENVLFIDDDITNLAEAKFYSPQLITAKPKIINELMQYIAGVEKKDKNHTRLTQYKLLEKKETEQKKYDNNEDFLFASNIQVVIKEDCKPNIERIHDLLMRTNQLNYTKQRISLDELNALFDDNNARCGYVSVKDKFGDYGIVGFYSLIHNKLEHFLFSCRTIGLGVEQYVYSYLQCPELKTNGEVIVQVERKTAPAWINRDGVQNTESINQQPESVNHNTKILIKGPCDLSKAMTYIKNSDSLEYEFTYVNEKKGNIIEAHNHSVHILGQIEYSDNEKDTIANDCIFVDRTMMDGKIFHKKYDIIFLSTLIEANYGVYQKKDSDLKVAFGSYIFPLTDANTWSKYINNEINTGGNSFTEQYLKKFSKAYEFIGKSTPEQYIERITKIISYLGKNSTLCLILGVEFPCNKSMEYDFAERHISHLQLNEAIRTFAKNNARIKLIDLNDIVKTQSDFTNNLNHFTTRVYYEIAQKMIAVISEKSDVKLEKHSVVLVYLDNAVGKIKNIVKHCLTDDSTLFKLFYTIYKPLARKKS